MQPPSQLTYALRALVDLALHQGSGPIRIVTIAKRQGIPVRTLEQLFNRLKRSGLIEAERGPRGGYRLTRPAGEIPVKTVVEVIQPKGLFTGRKRTENGKTVSDPAAHLWKQVEQAVHTTLEAATLETLVDQVRDQASSPMDHRYTFHI